MDRNPAIRLGMPGCPQGPIRSHPFFRSLDWKKIESRQINPSFRPVVVSFFCRSYLFLFLFIYNEILFHFKDVSVGREQF